MFEHEHSAELRMTLRQHVRRMGLDEETAQALELAGTIRMLANLYEAAIAPDRDLRGLSSARWDVLTILWGCEQLHLAGTVTPTLLSHLLRVSRNTISSLLRGLEEQELIVRELDAADHRVFRVRLTDVGRERLARVWPTRLQKLSALTAGLTAAEQTQLLHLLDKLCVSLVRHTRGPTPCAEMAAD